MAAGALETKLSVHLATRSEVMEHEAEFIDWQLYARETGRRAEEEYEDGEIFSDSHSIVTLILNDVWDDWKSEFYTAEGDQCFLCIDTAKRLQAVALAHFTKEKCFLSYLASNPYNIRHRVHKRALIRGAGTAIVTHLIQRRKPIILTAFDTSIPFYTKLGFVMKDERFVEMERPVDAEVKGEE